MKGGRLPNSMHLRVVREQQRVNTPAYLLESPLNAPDSRYGNSKLHKTALWVRDRLATVEDAVLTVDDAVGKLACAVMKEHTADQVVSIRERLGDAVVMGIGRIAAHFTPEDHEIWDNRPEKERHFS